MIGVFQSVALFGSVLGVALGGIIGVALGWRYAFGLVAVPGLLFAVLMFFVRDYENPPLATEQMNSNRFSQWSGYLKEMFRKPVLWLVYLGSAIQFFVIATIGNWMPSFFNRVYGLPADQAG
ncbi:MFS transporter, partial [Salmonella enterica]